MRLTELLTQIPGLTVQAGPTDKTIAQVTANSRAVQPGGLFVALVGKKTDGHDFIDEAIANGAEVIVTDGRTPDVPAHICVLASPDSRADYARLAARMYPARPAILTGVTGTNGKTSVCEYLRQIWSRATWPSASVGTLGVASDIEALNSNSAQLTTPPSEQLFSLLHNLRKGGITHAAFEASSHGLDQMRLHQLAVNVAVFTNLSRDHLDWHGDMDSYFAAKAKLFFDNLLDGGTAVINIDDKWGQRLYDLLQSRDIVLWSVGVQDKADFQIISADSQHFGLDLQVKSAGQTFRYPLALSGEFQAINAVTAAAAAHGSGMPLQDSFGALPYLSPVRGRMQPIRGHPAGARVIIDFAHTPDALEGALKGLRTGTSGRLNLVFGCGGDRDKGKRAEMGKIAATHADKIYVTDDNPRTERPAAIRSEILSGCPEAYDISPRDKAIQMAIAELDSEDTLLIAGKGHETSQTIGTEVLPFDDASVARHALMNLPDSRAGTGEL